MSCPAPFCHCHAKLVCHRTFQSGLAVKLTAAGNEWESFQVLMRSDSPIEGVNVEAGDLQGPDGSVIRAGDARLFRQHQLEMTDGTYRNEQFEPGWYADPLIPFKHPLTRKPLESARFKMRNGATCTGLSTSGALCSRCSDPRVPPSGRRRARRFGPTRRSANATPLRGGTSTSRYSTTECPCGSVGDTGSEASFIGAACATGVASRILGRTRRRWTVVPAARTRSTTAKERSSIPAAPSATTESLPACG